MRGWPESVQDYAATRSALWRLSDAEPYVAIRDHMRRDSHWRCVFTHVAARIYHIACKQIENNEITSTSGVIDEARSNAITLSLRRSVYFSPTTLIRRLGASSRITVSPCMQ